MAFVQAVLANPLIPRDERQIALDRIYTAPRIPERNGSTSSFWLKKPHTDLHNIHSDGLPETADVVIIGSGITATSVAKTLLTSEAAAGSNLRIVLLEARDVCSGATGRNGGHCLETAEEYLELKEIWGKESAQKILRFRMKHLDALMETAEAYGLVEEAQVRRVQFLSAHFDEESWKYSQASVAAFKDEMPEEYEKMELGVVDDQAEIADYRMPKAVGIVKGYAGALWPYKFVTSILAKLRRDHQDRFSIETHTPVKRIKKSDNIYHVETSRSTIKARHVVHCTNGYVAYLVPELLGKVYPVRGQMSAQTAPKDLPNNSYRHSWLLNYGSGFDYLTQLPVVDGTCNGQMMLGGGFVNSPYGGIRELGFDRDDTLESGATKHLEETLANVFDIEHNSNGVESMWTGTMGFSSDGLPWVGEVPEGSESDSHNPRSEGTSNPGRQWVAAGFSGEGMVNTWLSGEALGLMLLGFEQGRSESVRTELLQWFPKEMLITKERMAESKIPRKLPADSEEAEGDRSNPSVSSADAMQAARL